MYKQNRFIKLSEIAKILDISRPLLQKWEKKGLPVIRRKKGVAVVTEAGLIRFLSSGNIKHKYFLEYAKKHPMIFTAKQYVDFKKKHDFMSELLKTNMDLSMGQINRIIRKSGAM